MITKTKRKKRNVRILNMENWAFSVPPFHRWIGNGKEIQFLSTRDDYFSRKSYGDLIEQLWEGEYVGESDTILEYIEECLQIVERFKARELTFEEARDCLEDTHEDLIQEELRDELDERALQLKYYEEYDRYYSNYSECYYFIDLQYLSDFRSARETHYSIMDLLEEESYELEGEEEE